MKIIEKIKKLKIIIDGKFFLKITKIKIVKIRSNNIGKASKLTATNVKINVNMYIIIFFKIN